MSDDRLTEALAAKVMGLYPTKRQGANPGECGSGGDLQAARCAGDHQCRSVEARLVIAVSH